MKKTVKIGVMTFSPMTLNPGTVLQSWSLCHFLDSIPGIESEVIWYRSNKSNNHSIFSLRASLKTLYIRFFQLLHCGFARKIRKYPTDRPLVRATVSSINGRYDMILVGSDQVWNPKITGNDNSFFLDFVKNAKKAAYAPSIGKDDWSDDIKAEIQGFLNDFEFIGIREKTSIPTVEKLSKKTVHWSIDPTFLINKTEWSKIALAPNKKKDSYIMGYCIKRKSKFPAIFTGYLTPSLVGVLIFFFLPLLMLLVTSFQKSPTNSDFVGFRNYERVLTNDAFINASKNTLTFALISVPLAVILALFVAMLLNSGLPGKSLFRSFLLNPMMVPVASVVLIWQVFFSYNGVINGIAEKIFDSPEKIDWLKSEYAQIVIMLLFLWKNLGYNMVLFLAALNSIPHEILESAEMDGAGPVKRFFAIKLHYLSPTIFFVGIMSLINSFKIFREVYLLTGDYPFANLYMLQHFMNNSFTHLDYSKLSAGAIIMCIVMVIIVGGLFFAESKFDKDVEG